MTPPPLYFAKIWGSLHLSHTPTFGPYAEPADYSAQPWTLLHSDTQPSTPISSELRITLPLPSRKCALFILPASRNSSDSVVTRLRAGGLGNCTSDPSRARPTVSESSHMKARGSFPGVNGQGMRLNIRWPCRDYVFVEICLHAGLSLYDVEFN
jgi:hypothetical protein